MRSEQLFITMPVSGQPPQFPAATLAPIDQPPQFPAATLAPIDQPPQFPAATSSIPSVTIQGVSTSDGIQPCIPSVTIQGVSTSDGIQPRIQALNYIFYAPQATSSEPPSVSVPNIQSPFNMCANFSAANFYLDSAFGVGTPGGRIPSNLNTPNVSCHLCMII